VALVLEQSVGRIELDDFPQIQHHNPIGVHNSFDSVGNRNDRRLFEALSDRLLNELVGFDVDVGSCFVD
jgi:hypothetical protein